MLFSFRLYQTEKPTRHYSALPMYLKLQIRIVAPNITYIDWLKTSSRSIERLNGKPQPHHCDAINNENKTHKVKINLRKQKNLDLSVWKKKSSNPRRHDLQPMHTLHLTDIVCSYTQRINGLIFNCLREFIDL